MNEERSFLKIQKIPHRVQEGCKRSNDKEATAIY